MYDFQGWVTASLAVNYGMVLITALAMEDFETYIFPSGKQYGTEPRD